MFALHGTVDCGVSREELPQGPIVILVLPLYLLYSSYTMHKINDHFFSFVKCQLFIFTVMKNQV